MNSFIKSFFSSVVILMSSSIFAGTVTLNGVNCGVFSGSVTVNADGDVAIVTADTSGEGGCGAYVTDTLTITSSGNGSVTSDSGGMNVSYATSDQQFIRGDVVILTATPGDGLKTESFEGWGGDGCVDGVNTTTNTCTVTMDGDVTVSAIFSNNNGPAPVILTTKATKGTITAPTECAKAGSCSYAAGTTTSVTVTATADTGYGFDSWSGCSSNNTAKAAKTASCTFTMGAEPTKAVTAVFTEIPDEPAETLNQPTSSGDYPTLNWGGFGRMTIKLQGSKEIVYQVKTSSDLTLGGRLSTAFTTGKSANRQITISTKPGDFDSAILGACASSGAETASIGWTQNPNLDFPYNLLSCNLKVDTTYYVNIRHTSCADNSVCEFYFSN